MARDYEHAPQVPCPDGCEDGRAEYALPAGPTDPEPRTRFMRCETCDGTGTVDAPPTDPRWAAFFAATDADAADLLQWLTAHPADLRFDRDTGVWYVVPESPALAARIVGHNSASPNDALRGYRDVGRAALATHTPEPR